MSGLLAQKERIGEKFTRSASIKDKATKKRPAPLSLRLSDRERAWLEAKANGAPLGTYIKERIFDEAAGSKLSPRSLAHDFELLAQLLATLGRSELFANLDSLVQQVEAGNLILSPEAEFEIGVACACVLQMRDDLIEALGLKAGGVD